MNISIINTVTIIALCFGSFSAIAQKATPPTKRATIPTTYNSKGKNTNTSKTVGAKIQFEKNAFDFGTVTEDKVVKHSFDFKNVGTSDLVITNVKTSCGCTVPSYPLTPIRPNEKGTIEVSFTAKNKVGPQTAEVTVMTNGTPKAIKIKLNGWVDQIKGGVKEK